MRDEKSDQRTNPRPPQTPPSARTLRAVVNRVRSSTIPNCKHSFAKGPVTGWGDPLSMEYWRMQDVTCIRVLTYCYIHESRCANTAHVYLNTCIQACMYVRMHACMCTCIYNSVYTYVRFACSQADFCGDRTYLSWAFLSKSSPLVPQSCGRSDT